MQFGLACCAIEMIATTMARYDLARFGAEVFRPSPRQADLMIISGTVTKKMAPQVVRLYNQMAEPKYVIAMGACAISGGPFKQGYNVLKGIDRYIPVDVHIPGMPAAAGGAAAGVHDAAEEDRRAAFDRRRTAAASGCRGAGRVSGAGAGRARSGAAVEPGGVAVADDDQVIRDSGTQGPGTRRGLGMKTVEEIKAAIEAAVPGAGVEIVPTPARAGSIAAAEPGACDGGGDVSAR